MCEPLSYDGVFGTHHWLCKYSGAHRTGDKRALEFIASTYCSYEYSANVQPLKYEWVLLLTVSCASTAELIALVIRTLPVWKSLS